MRTLLLILFLSPPAICAAGSTDSSRDDKPSDREGTVRQQPAGQESGSVDSLLAEMNRNNGNTVKLLDRIVSEGCNRQLQVDTIKLVANMNRNIQIMTNIMVRMGYNIEEMSRAPKAMNDIPFMP